jgi:hypothetical protein
MGARPSPYPSAARRGRALGLLIALFCGQLFAADAAANVFVADRREYRPADQPLLRSVGILVNARRQVGTAFLVGECHVMTAFHSAFFRDVQARSSDELVDGPRPGHALAFYIGPDPERPGLFRRRSVARVVDYGNYHPAVPRGMTGDWAILQLEDCLGREYGVLPYLRPTSADYLPHGPLMTISFPYSGWNRPGVAVEEGCRARESGPVTGLIAVDCAFEGGMSGGPVLEQGPDGEWRVVGIMQLRFSPVERVLPAFEHRHRNQMVHAVAFFRSLARVLAGTPVREPVADARAEAALAFERAAIDLVLRTEPAAGEARLSSWRGDLNADAADELILRLCRREVERGQRCAIHVLTPDRGGRPRVAGVLADAEGPVRLGFARLGGVRPLIIGPRDARRSLVLDSGQGREPRLAERAPTEGAARLGEGARGEDILRVETLVDAPAQGRAE